MQNDIFKPERSSTQIGSIGIGAWCCCLHDQHAKCRGTVVSGASGDLRTPGRTIAQTAHDMPTSLRTLKQYRAAHGDGPESDRVWLFHSHIYFDHTAQECIAEARAFMALIQKSYATTDHLEVHSFIPAPAGPHPCGSFEILFTREIFTDFISWLMFMRPERLNILTHPLSRSQVLDHTVRAIWLGKPLPIDRTMLESVDAKLSASGQPEEIIIDRIKKH